MVDLSSTFAKPSLVYNDIVVLPVSENMNSGKTHAFFSWAAEGAWVPPITGDYDAAHSSNTTYSNITAETTFRPASHDPKSARFEWQTTSQQKPWVRPDFVVKVDDDSFVMLAELEARLRVELYTKTRTAPENDFAPDAGKAPEDIPKSRAEATYESTEAVSSASATGTTGASADATTHEPRMVRAHIPQVPATADPAPHVAADDPLIYWGYLVKNQFMAGEIYALSWPIVDWVSRDPAVKGMTRGKEDKQVSKWMRTHPRAPEVRWKSERCWIYDHPRAGTV